VKGCIKQTLLHPLCKRCAANLAGVYLVNTEHGHGLKVNRDIRSGHVFAYLTYGGEVLTKQALKSRYDDDDDAPYVLQNANGSMSDAALCRSWLSMINSVHNSKRPPNVEFFDAEKGEVKCRAVTDISKGTELLANYIVGKRVHHFTRGDLLTPAILPTFSLFLPAKIGGSPPKAAPRPTKHTSHNKHGPLQLHRCAAYGENKKVCRRNCRNPHWKKKCLYRGIRLE
jgi:hypothetical protein